MHIFIQKRHHRPSRWWFTVFPILNHSDLIETESRWCFQVEIRSQKIKDRWELWHALTLASSTVEWTVTGGLDFAGSFRRKLGDWGRICLGCLCPSSCFGPSSPATDAPVFVPRELIPPLCVQRIWVFWLWVSVAIARALRYAIGNWNKWIPWA